MSDLTLMRTLVKKQLKRIYRKLSTSSEPQQRKFEFAISIYTGDSPFSLKPPAHADLPVLTWRDVHDISASFVADPFLIRTDSQWFMFFEVLNREKRKGEISVATSRDGLKWEYAQQILAEPFSLSYPLVFDWAGDIYMIPESLRSGGVRLYRAKRFPTEWTFVQNLIEGTNFADATLVHFEGRWWLFVETSPAGFDTLRLFYSHDLFGSWVEHPSSPLIQGDNRRARPAGRLLQYESRLHRFAQDCHPNYGTHVRAFEITELSPRHYHEREIDKSPILGARRVGWNSDGMHHIDAQPVEGRRWMAAVDGWCWLKD